MTNKVRPKYNLLKDAYAIIDGVPDKQFGLKYIATTLDKVPQRTDKLKFIQDILTLSPGFHTNLLCCGIGWLLMHPMFRRRGLGAALHSNGIDGDLTFKGKIVSYDRAAAKLFNMELHHADALFGPVQRGERRGRTDKQIWQSRVRNFLGGRGQL